MMACFQHAAFWRANDNDKVLNSDEIRNSDTIYNSDDFLQQW